MFQNCCEDFSVGCATDLATTASETLKLVRSQIEPAEGLLVCEEV